MRKDLPRPLVRLANHGYLTVMTGADFAFPTSIALGAGRVAALRERLAGFGSARPLLVTDAGLVMTRAFQLATGAAPARCVVFSGVHSNPTAEDVDAAVDAFVANGCDAVIAVGGGSAIDVAKVLRLRVQRADWRLDDP